MKESMNVPYVVKKNKDGMNIPLNENYISEFPNRRERREYMQKKRLHGESKNHHLTVLPTGKYRRVRQFEYDKKGNFKVIEHYILIHLSNFKNN